MEPSSVINGSNIFGLIQRTLNHVDSRLVDHGRRVAYLVGRMLDARGGYTEREKQDICFVTLLHDVGAYKTEEISQMEKFEAENIWGHSIYGYLFLHHLSPLKDWAGIVLYHHVSAGGLAGVEERIAKVAQILNLADRVDMFWMKIPDRKELEQYLLRNRGRRFREDVVDLFFKADAEYGMLDAWASGQDILSVLTKVTLSARECETYLKMLIFSIDFRSQHTVTHTITTTSISSAAARFMGMSPQQVHEVYYGALLHDLGKIGIPVEILEFPGKLSPQAMDIMRTHVDITEEILGGKIDPVVTRIALRHHEKLDGSGYPRGLKECMTTPQEQVVAVADIASALLGTRSYKEAFSKDRTLDILKEQAGSGKISCEIVDVVTEHFDEILSEVTERCTPILRTYYGLKEEYEILLQKFQGTTTVRSGRGMGAGHGV